MHMAQIAESLLSNIINLLPDPMSNDSTSIAYNINAALPDCVQFYLDMRSVGLHRLTNPYTYGFYYSVIIYYAA